MEYIIKRIDKSQIKNLKLLFSSVYHKNSLGLEDIDKRFQTSEFGLEYLGYLAYPNNNNTEMPAAYYGVFPMLASIKGRKILCAQSGDTMTHKDHRKKGLFIKLAKLTYETAKREGVEFIFGFPSPSSYPGFKHKLEWVFPFNMVKFSRFVPTIPLGQMKKYFKMKTGNFNYVSQKYLDYINIFSRQEFNIWNNENDDNFIIIRNESYRNYKYYLKKNKFFLEKENMGILLKYDGNISIGGIYGNTNEILLKKNFRNMDILAFLMGSIQIRSFFTPNSPYNELLSPFGTLSEAMPYGYLNLTNKYDPSKLELTFLDYDYF